MKELNKEKREQIKKWCLNENNIITIYVGLIRDGDALIVEEYGKIMMRLHTILFNNSYTDDEVDGEDRDWGYLDRLQELTDRNKQFPRIGW
jgi:hypothetical protein